MTTEKDVIARAAAERLARLNTPGAAFQALDGYPDADLRDPSIADVEQTALPLGDAPRRGKTNDAVRGGR